MSKQVQSETKIICAAHSSDLNASKCVEFIIITHIMHIPT